MAVSSLLVPIAMPSWLCPTHGSIREPTLRRQRVADDRTEGEDATEALASDIGRMSMKGTDMAMMKQTIRVAGHSIAYHREGKGEPVLLVHGITTYSFIWRAVIPLLSAAYDVIAVDLLGCGDSDKPPDVSYALKDHAERLHEFMTKLGVPKFHFVGHDLGGGMGQIFAVRHPEMLIDLTMINTVAYDFWPVQPITALRTPVVRFFLMATFDLGTFRLVVKRGVYHKDRVTKELMDLFMQPMKTVEGRKAFLHFAKCLDNQNLMEIERELRTLKFPVLIIRGDADHYLGAAISEKLHSEIAGSRLVRISTGGHFIQEDEPELLATDMMAFFRGEHDAAG
jgi:pimeloyl-ACP methyl ester carboxylesterase